ncbi:ABC transporter permease, partial [Intestinibacter sp.]|uniref:ABC transporter permease n=1 Tax=Intestinibacter sp. TaxID=1965304 RepID=UPI002A74AD07
KLPYSLTIGMGGVISSAFIAFFLGYLAALKDNGIADKITRFLSLFALTVPNFIISVIIIYFIGVKFKLTKFFTGDGRSSVIVATALISFYLVGRFSRIVKTHFREQINQSYIKFAISRGFKKELVLLKHGYKPVLYGLLSIVISNFAWVLGGSSVLEFAFGIPGISYFLINSLKANDYYVIQSYIMVIVIWMFFVHLIFNEVLRALDVRERR